MNYYDVNLTKARINIMGWGYFEVVHAILLSVVYLHICLIVL